jgi:hypothetical protein
MRGKNYITINGERYDAVTGLRIETTSQPVVSTKPSTRGTVMSDVGFVSAKKRQAQAEKMVQDKKPLQPRSSTTATQTHAVHQQPSKTLRRTGLKKPILSATAHAKAVTRSPHIARFASSAHPIPKPVQRAVTPVKRTTHVQASPISQAVKKQQLSSKQLKHELIKKGLRNVDTIAALDKSKKSGPLARIRSKHPRFGAVFTSVVALVLLGGYLTYINMPGLSMKVAASRANVAATFPNYNPSGYSFNGPVAFSQGEVKVGFKSNTNNFAYTVTEKTSPWDSQALLDNYVAPDSSNNYVTLQDSGLTIYLHDNKASWVNGGVLYSIEYSAAPLSSDQLQRIATSTL